VGSSSTDYDEWAYEGGRTRFSLVAADGARSPLSVAYRIVVQIFQHQYGWHRRINSLVPL